jgi:hypothetical protein
MVIGPNDVCGCLDHRLFHNAVAEIGERDQLMPEEYSRAPMLERR